MPNKKNIILFAVLLVSGIVCITTGILMDFHMIPGGKPMKGVFKTIHTYSGYIMALGMLLHIYWHRAWIVAAAKLCIGKK